MHACKLDKFSIHYSDLVSFQHPQSSMNGRLTMRNKPLLHLCSQVELRSTMVPQRVDDAISLFADTGAYSKGALLSIERHLNLCLATISNEKANQVIHQPSNKSITAQRHLYSTKRKRQKPRLRIAKPTNKEKDSILESLLSIPTIHISEEQRSDLYDSYNLGGLELQSMHIKINAIIPNNTPCIRYKPPGIRPIKKSLDHNSESPNKADHLAPMSLVPIWLL